MIDTRLKLAYIIVVVIILSTVIFGCISKENIEEKAYDDVIKELQENGHPVGMFGTTWYMTQQEVKNLFGNISQLNTNILVQERNLYDRPIQASYHFTDNRLMIIVVSFKDDFRSLKEFADAFYKVQHYLSLDYGQMPEPFMHEIIPSTDNKWTNQDFLESEKKMGRTTLVHRIKIKDNSAGEQIIMYLSKKDK
ncbi:MAG: hypothetical protein Q8M92_00030 [Candidatus Subteraquimicrobiales bacterium]|nr:hypothetical protein [Candidatus Subteraquimicrobiales bacterium]